MASRRRRERSLTRVTDLLVLDADGVSKAAGDDRVAQAWLQRAQELDADLGALLANQPGIRVPSGPREVAATRS